MGLIRPAAEIRAITTLPWTDSFRTSAGESVNADKVLELPAVWRATSLVAETLGGLPLDTVRTLSNGANSVVASRPLISNPSLRLTRREWVYTYVISMMLHGNAYGVVLARDPKTGEPTVIEWADPWTVQVEEYNQFDVPRYYIDGKLIRNEDIIHVRNFLKPGCIVGLSPIEYHAETFGIAMAARKYGARYFGDGAHPTAILSTEMKLTKEQADTMKKGFVASLKSRREPAVLGSAIKYERVQDDPETAGLYKILNESIRDVALIFGVPLEYLYAAVQGSSRTYANREQMLQDFMDTCLSHYATRLEDALSNLLVRGQTVKFNFDAFLRGDTATRYAAHAVGISAGFLTIDEVRGLEDLAPLPKPEAKEPEPAQAIELAGRAPSLIQAPGLPALADQLRVLNDKEPKYTVAPEPPAPPAAPAEPAPPVEEPAPATDDSEGGDPNE